MKKNEKVSIGKLEHSRYWQYKQLKNEHTHVTLDNQCQALHLKLISPILVIYLLRKVLTESLTPGANTKCMRVCTLCMYRSATQ